MVRADLRDPRVVVAGVVAPLFAGAAVVFADNEPRGGFVVGEGPEARSVALPDL